MLKSCLLIKPLKQKSHQLSDGFFILFHNILSFVHYNFLNFITGFNLVNNI